MVRKFTLFLLLLTFAVAVQAQVVRTFVSTSGSDANPCTRPLPCRNFNQAVFTVDAGGEVVALDSGGYGAVTINKKVLISAPLGIHVAIAPTAGAAIQVVTNDEVSIKGLFLNGQGADVGVRVSFGWVLLENLNISNFTAMGVQVTGGNDVLISHSTLHHGPIDSVGVYVDTGATRTPVAIDSSTIENWYRGVWNEDSRVLIRNSMVAFNQIGVATHPISTGLPITFIENSAIYKNAAEGVLSRQNTAGSQEFQYGTVYISNNVITENNIGVSTNGGQGYVYTYENNKIHANNTDIPLTLFLAVPQR